ncbi:MAG TPA: thymidylate synthase [Prevotella sp.]|nr:thymidylate synthase [Prevotella sp.]
MKIIQPQFEIWPQAPGIDGMYRQIERVGRVCYKSEDHCTPTSARPFVERMLKNRHLAMLEHGTVYLQVAAKAGNQDSTQARYDRNKFSVVRVHDGVAYVTTNLRVLAENDWMDDLQLLCEPTEHHERRVTVHFTTQIAITREFNRHRVDSMAEQSTRYCNYSKDKFGSEIAINLPLFVDSLPQDDYADSIACGNVALEGNYLVDLARKVATGEATDIENWLFANAAAERAYMNLVAAGRKPQEARVVLPLDTNTELVHTAFVSDWKHFFDLRALGTTGAPHPDAKALALPLYQRFVEEGWIAPDK